MIRSKISSIENQVILGTAPKPLSKKVLIIAQNKLSQIPSLNRSGQVGQNWMRIKPANPNNIPAMQKSLCLMKTSINKSVAFPQDCYSYCSQRIKQKPQSKVLNAIRVQTEQIQNSVKMRVNWEHKKIPWRGSRRNRLAKSKMQPKALNSDRKYSLI